MTEPCEICKKPSGSQPINGYKVFDCRRCGRWTTCGQLIAGQTIPQIMVAGGGRENHYRARLSHIVRRQQQPEKLVCVSALTFTESSLDDPLPSPAEMIDNIVLFTGERQPDYLTRHQWNNDELAALIGAPLCEITPSAPLDWLMNQPVLKKFIEPHPSLGSLRLSLDGWQRYDDLRLRQSESKRAFMAMKFGDAELDTMFESCFKTAVAATGFELRRLDEHEPAGLIDDQLRVALRQAKFVIADLTHANRGAYWEAGFAEGAAKHVIYTCSQQRWNEEKTHFDTNHLRTIIWDPAKPKEAARRLKATVRATFPAEAYLED